LQEKGTNPFYIALSTDIATIAALRIMAAYHLFDCFLHTGSLVGWQLFPSPRPPVLPVVNKYSSKTVTTIFCMGVKQHDS
jgi:hypothetical protein